VSRVIVLTAVAASVIIREARPDDAGLIYGWIVELAEYERARDQVTGTAQQLSDALFGAAPSAEALIGSVVGESGRVEPAGFALFHGTFSTWECLPGLWLEDLFVSPEQRRFGVGGALIRRVAAIAMERGCTRLEWSVLDWNAPALGFYAGLGAARLEDWTVHRLDGESLARVAGSAASASGRLTD
jgi:GNAT superfamily N-acetyltransferase